MLQNDLHGFPQDSGLFICLQRFYLIVVEGAILQRQLSRVNGEAIRG